MRKKLVIIVLLLLFVGLFYFYFQKETYSGTPKDWFDGEKIDLVYASEGEMFQDDDLLQYKKDELVTAFSLEGFFKGEKFLNEYSVDGKVLMRVSQELNHDDGIIDGFIFEKFDDGVVKAFLFVDDDWKRLVGETNVFWGVDFEHEQSFIFNEVKPGIYMNTIIDDVSRFSDDFSLHFGGVMMGDISRSDSEGKTVIVLR